jgi:hypothetical protein
LTFSGAASRFRPDMPNRMSGPSVKLQEDFMTGEKPSKAEPVKQPENKKAETPKAIDELDEISLGLVTGGTTTDPTGCLTTE